MLLLRNNQTRLTAVQVALAFLNESAGSTHGNVRVDSIFISASGEWKLGGFDVLSNQKDDAAVLYVRCCMYDRPGLPVTIYAPLIEPGRYGSRRINLLLTGGQEGRVLSTQRVLLCSGAFVFPVLIFPPGYPRQQRMPTD